MREKVKGGDLHLERMIYLIGVLNHNSYLYHNESGTDEMLQDSEYDRLSEELRTLEELTGVVLPNSPSRNVGYLPNNDDKAAHIRPILSLKSTKCVDELLYFIGQQEAMLSWKLDGISLVLYYRKGKLVNALTRGDGHIGRVVLDKVILIRTIPKEIPIIQDLVVRGECCISLRDFEEIKNTKTGEQFSNPRNLAAGIINMATPSMILLKHVTFVAHSLVHILNDKPELKKRSDQLGYLRTQGFTVVPHSIIYNFQLKYEVEKYTSDVSSFEFPVDGLVLTINDISYGENLGETARYPKHSLAFKWPDEHKTTTVKGMKWSVSRTGLITPVVIFEPIELEGTIVRQANLHSLKGFEDLAIGKGDILEVYKANKIIPEVANNFTRSETEKPPDICPECGEPTKIVETVRTRKLYCTGDHVCYQPDDYH